MPTSAKSDHFHLTRQIVIAMLLSTGLGIAINSLHLHAGFTLDPLLTVLDVGGKIFIATMKMLVVPIVFVSLICGSCQLGSGKQLGRLAGKTIGLYLFTTAIAIALAIFIAHLSGIGIGSELKTTTHFAPPPAPSLAQTIIGIFPTNPIASMAQGNMLQIIVFALLMGIAIAWSGKAGQRLTQFFNDMNAVILKLITLIIKIAPYGVFCLLTVLIARTGLHLVAQLFGYFLTVVLALLLHVSLSYSLLIRFVGNLNPLKLFRKFLPAMLFAFSTSSSNASIPVVLRTAEKKLGVNNTIASFIIPLGATINMDGTAIMQGVATVFIGQAYGIDIGLAGYLTVILTATLASIGTAGVPGVGLITLAMVLQQVGLPVEGIALIIGVDRLLDMLRTAVNVTGDATVACIVAKSEKAMDVKQFNKLR